MLIIDNQYHSICRLSTSITRRSLCLNYSMHLSKISCGVFHSVTVASFKGSRLVFLQPWSTFCSISPQTLKSTGFKSDLFCDQGWGSSKQSFSLSFNISKVSLAIWGQALSCMNKNLLSFACLFFSVIIFLNSTLHNTWHLPMYWTEQKTRSFNSFWYRHKHHYFLGI